MICFEKQDFAATHKSHNLSLHAGTVKKSCISCENFAGWCWDDRKHRKIH